jgi:hypothetical protein
MTGSASNKPVAYCFNSLYKSYYCNQNLKKLLLGDETGTWAYVFVNYFSWFMSRQYDLQLIKANGKEVYVLPPKKGEWKGYPLYEASSHGKEGACILLLQPGKLPWTYLTQEQYLKALKEYWEEKRREAVQSFVRQDSGWQKSVDMIQRNNSIKAEDKQKILDGLNKDHTRSLSTRVSDIARNNKYYNEKISVIDNYLVSAGATTLQQPANLDRNMIGDFNGQFSNEQKGGQYLVTFNDAYYNPRLPGYVPQMMVLYWRWEKNPPSQNFKRQFEQNFPVEKLQAMLGVPG